MRKIVKFTGILLCLSLTAALVSCSGTGGSNADNARGRTDAVKQNGTGLNGDDSTDKGEENKNDTAAFALSSGKKYVEVSGVVRPKTSKVIMLGFEAKVLDIHVLPGQRVKKGDELITLDMKQYDLELKGKQSEYNLAKIDFSNLVKNNAVQQEELERMAADICEMKKALEEDTDPEILKLQDSLKMAETSFESLKAQLDNMQVLLDKGAVSRSEYDALKAEADKSFNNKESIKYDIDIYRSSRQQQIRQMEEDYLGKKVDNTSGTGERAKAQEQIVRLQSLVDAIAKETTASWIDGNRIVMDVESGVVSMIDCKPGEIVGAGRTLIGIDSTEEIIVRADIPEESINNVRIGSQVSIHPAASREKIYRGTVKAISNIAVQKGQGTYITADISIDDADDWLKLGFNVSVRIMY